jgi:zinc transport system ATP-binding protein
MMTDNALEFNNVSFGYTESPVISGLTFNICRGDYAVLTGSNGSGKSTILRLTLGGCQATCGEIKLFNEPIHNFRQWSKIGYVPQNPLRDRSFPVTVEEIVAMGRVAVVGMGRSLGKTDRGAIDAAISAMHIGPIRHQLIGNLSGGQQQRVLVARALAAEAEFIILDEPTTGMDADARIELYTLLDAMQKKSGKTILMVSHEIEYVAQHASKIFSMEKGILRPILQTGSASFRNHAKGVIQHA